MTGRRCCTCRFNNLEVVVKALIEAGADVNKAANDGRRRCTGPLRMATRRWSRR